jgi:DNA-binding NarL/FixJ family response regulator
MAPDKLEEAIMDVIMEEHLCHHQLLARCSIPFNVPRISETTMSREKEILQLLIGLSRKQITQGCYCFDTVRTHKKHLPNFT